MKVNPDHKKPAGDNEQAAEAAQSPPGSSEAETDHDVISRRAYQLWIEHGRISGFDVENWRDAERWFEEQNRQIRRISPAPL